MIGVYKITNLLNNDCYIGSSKDIAYRWKKHLSTYNRKGKQYNYHLYRALRKYGVENFEFKVIELCSEEERITLEQKYYDLYKPRYNEIQPKENPMECENVRKHHRESCKNAWKNHNKETKNKIIENLKKGWKAENSLEKRNPPKKIKAIRISDNEIMFFNSLCEAERKLGVQRSSISQVLNPSHIRKQAKGYKFEYVSNNF